MNRRILVGLSLLGSFAVALGLGLLLVPHQFSEGSPMSASGMNANLESVSSRIRAASDSLAASSLVRLEFKGRLDEVFPGAQGPSHDQPEASPSLQQASPRVAPGSVADPSIVNGFFSDFADQMGAADELTQEIMEELTLLSVRMTAAEQAFGLTTAERAEAVVFPYTPPELTVFRRNTRTVPDEMNGNFTAVVTSLMPLEQNAAELADWLEHERARLEAVESAAAVGDPVEPGAVIQATLGYHHLDEALDTGTVTLMLMLFNFEPESAGDVASVTVTGPPGWNRGMPFEVGNGHRYGRGLYLEYPAPYHEVLDGDYTVTARVGGREYRTTSTVDTTPRLPDITGQEISVDEDGIHLSWNPVAGAVSYMVHYNDAYDEETPAATWVTLDTSFTIPVPRSELIEEELGRYYIFVYARNFNPEDPDDSVDFNTQLLETRTDFLIMPWSRF